MTRTCSLLLLLAATAAADPLLLTEVVTDPQADHSESTGGNGMPYDGLPGSGTVSTVDEFVELYNAGACGLDLRGYVLEFLDSSPTSYEFGSTSGGVLWFTDGSSLTRLRPGGFVVLGNPPGALNNGIDILLKNPAGSVIERLAILDGNATSAADEAVARAWTGLLFQDRFLRAPISPGGPGTPVPEPRGLAWLGLSLLLAARATARRARRAARRTPPVGPPTPPAPRAAG